jgi:nitroreductase
MSDYAKVDLSTDEPLTTTRSVRKRLDLTKPVPIGLIRECVEIAVQAPTSSDNVYHATSGAQSSSRAERPPQ